MEKIYLIVSGLVLVLVILFVLAKRLKREEREKPLYYEPGLFRKKKKHEEEVKDLEKGGFLVKRYTDSYIELGSRRKKL